MTLMVWDTDQLDEALIEKYEHHSEFVVGLDWNLEFPGLLASCSWDETVYVWQQGEEPIPTHDEFAGASSSGGPPPMGPMGGPGPSEGFR